MARTPTKRRPRARARRNAPPGQHEIDVPVGDTLVAAVLMSTRVLELAYVHVASAQPKPYRHAFERGCEMYALEDGSVLIRHPRKRLHSDFTVGDDE